MFKTRDKEFYSTIIALAILVSIVFFFIKEFLLVVVIWAAVFFIYALSNFPPDEVEHKITNQGITSLGQTHLWDDLGPFWFVEKNGTNLLKIASRRNLLGELTILLGSENRENIRKVLAEYLPYLETPQHTFADKASDWLVSKFSFEKPPKAV